MRARRIIAVSPDQAVAARLVTALAAAGTVDVVPAPDDAGAAALCVLHVDGEASARALLPRVPAGCPVIALVPRGDLAGVVTLMDTAEQVAGIVVAEDFDPRQLAAMAERLLDRARFGVADVVAPGTAIHTEVVGDYAEKVACMARVATAADQLGVPRRYQEPIEQCLDEMLMNGLYDAPVGADGARLFAGVPTRTRITMRTEHQVTVEYAFDGARFALAVRDAFGTLDRQTVLRYLHKCLHSAQQVDRKAGGAGVGLYLMLTAATAVHFTVVPGSATEALCVFEVDAPAQLARFGFFARPPVEGGAATTATRRPSAATQRRRRVRAAIGAAVAAVVVATGVVAWPRLFGPTTADVTITTIPAGATLEVDGRVVGVATGGTFVARDLSIGRAYPIVARLDRHDPAAATVRPEAGGTRVTLRLPPLPTLELDSDPSDAAIAIDGAAMGSTPLALSSLPAGATVTIVFDKPGYQRATAQVQVPPAGEVKRFVQPLARSEDFVRVRFVSNPPGAEVVREGQAATTDRTYTPAELYVEAGKEQRFVLTMPKHVPLVIPPFTPERGAHGLEKGGDLVPGVTLRLEGAAGGTVTVTGAAHCTERAVPADCTLTPGTYAVAYRGADGTTTSRTVMLSRDTVERFAP